jgi:hypothetical protein
LNVHVNGKSKISNSNSIGITFGQLWKNEKQKIQYGLGMNLTYVSSNIHCVLKNKNNEVVSNINGANGHEVIDFVNEHYGAGHHVFENNFNLRSYTTNIEASIQKEIAEGTSIYTTIGCGVSFLDLKNATSMQTSPASTPPGFETTDDLDGGAVNHFNGGNHAGDLTFNTTAKIGLSHDLKNNLVLLLEGQSQFIGKGDFIFGSTQYSDHAPTNHWRMTKAANNCYTMTLGLRFNFN